jgi:hypothetical protein
MDLLQSFEHPSARSSTAPCQTLGSLNQKRLAQKDGVNMYDAVSLFLAAHVSTDPTIKICTSAQWQCAVNGYGRMSIQCGTQL